MKKKFLSVMSGVLVCLSLVFASCGNADNALEEIVYGTNSPLKNLVDGDEITINTEVLQGKESRSMALKFKKTGNTFEIDEAALNDAVKNMLGPKTTEMKVKKFITLMKNACTVKLENNQLRFEMVISQSDLGVSTRSTNTSTEMPMLIATFDLSTNKYAQYPYMFEGCFIFDNIEINGVKQNIPTDYAKEAPFYMNAGMDTRATEAYRKIYCLFYKDGETWADVNKRYSEQAGYPLLGTYGELKPYMQYALSDIEDAKDFAYINCLGSFAPFAYLGNITSAQDFLSQAVKANDKVGYKADGKTTNPEGYLFDYSSVSVE